jgi:diaminohydroxyphosphoribosylaminopyrimidine deaminase/5-amino-6-(5-phosphoribosylamino)uracil reductase
MLEAGIGRAVVAMEDPDPRMRGQGLRRLREAGLEVVCGVLEEQARGLNPGFVSRMSRGRPWVRLKLAVSLDGRTALANGQSRWISSKASRADVQRWRARSSAVMTGLGTVQADDPSLNVRLTAAELGQASPPRQPRRVILDTGLRMPAGARLLDLPGETIILTGDPDPGRRSELERRGVRVVSLATHHDHLDLQAVMTRLGDLEFNEVQVECGQRLAGSLLEAGLVDELLVYMAPHLLGSRAMGMAMLNDFDDMRERLELSFREVTFVGPDLRILAVPRQVG